MTSCIEVFLFCGKYKTAIPFTVDYPGRNIFLSLVISSISILFTNLYIANWKTKQEGKTNDEN